MNDEKKNGISRDPSFVRGPYKVRLLYAKLFSPSGSANTP
jgi:hypothetical protein